MTTTTRVTTATHTNKPHQHEQAMKQTNTNTNTNTTTNSKQQQQQQQQQQQYRRSGRHGARNQHRHQKLCKWILDEFSYLEFLPGDIVLDIAGGKGELAARLAFCHQLQVVLVDPRPANLPETFRSCVLPKLPKRHQERLKRKQEEEEEEAQQNNQQQKQQTTTSSFIDSVFQERVQQLNICFNDTTIACHEGLQTAMQNCKLMIGMHADGATEYIVDAALFYRKPFCVIPCCVFPNLFQQRFITLNTTTTTTTNTTMESSIITCNNNDDDNDAEDPKQIQVRTHEQFCIYLQQKDARFQRKIVPFEGRNIAIVWDGK